MGEVLLWSHTGRASKEPREIAGVEPPASDDLMHQQFLTQPALHDLDKPVNIILPLGATASTDTRNQIVNHIVPEK